MRIRNLLIVPTTAVALALGATAGAANADDNVPPQLGSLWINPTSLGPEGGAVDMYLPVTDPDGTVTSVMAEAYSTHGGYVATSFNQDSGDIWWGSFYIPGLPSNDPDDWTVQITAVDDAGGSTTEALGSVNQAGPPPFDQVPDADASVSPQDLPSSGGPVTITATATDDHSVSEVTASITDDEGGQWVTSLGAVSASGYQGTWSAPANGAQAPHVYTVLVTATDDIGQQRFVNAGQVTVAGVEPPEDDQPPTIVTSSVDPRDLPSEGGVVDVQVQAADDVGIAEAHLMVVSPDGVTRDVVLTHIGGEMYGTQVQLASNNTATDQTWGLGATVTDTNGASDTTSLGTVTVTAVAPPQVAVSNPAVRLVADRPGVPVARTVKVSNVGGRKTGVRLRGLGGPFRISGDRAFRLDPGETRLVRVVFLTTSPGRYVDLLEIVRADGRQRHLGVQIVGRLH